MLSVKCIFALDYSGMISKPQFLCCLNKCICHLKICHCRILNRCIFPAGSFHADCSGSDHNITALDIQINSATCSNTHKCICTALHQFLHCNRCGWSANPGGCHTDLLTFQIACVGDKLPAVCHKFCILKMFCDLLTPLRISRQDHITPHIPRSDL